MSSSNSARDQMLQAQALIKEHRYAEARALLNTINHPKAREWLAKLDQLDLEFPVEPVSSKKPAKEKKSGGAGCLKLSLAGGCGVPAAFCLGLIVIAIIIAVLVQQGKKASTKEAIQRNNDLGTFTDPIPSGRAALFKDGTLKVVDVLRPANQRVKSDNMFNDDPAAGAEYVLVKFEIVCKASRCNPGLMSFHLMDANEKEWGEPLLLVLSDDFDSQEAITGGTAQGWQGFQFPIGEPIKTVKVEWSNETLQLALP